MNNNLTSQAATMTRNGVPNDVVTNLNPSTPLSLSLPPSKRKNNITHRSPPSLLNLQTNRPLPVSLIIFIPLVDNILYPALRRSHIRFTPIKRITLGFLLASLAMTSATIIQHFIYATGPCGTHMNSCPSPAPISVWTQSVPYVLIGFSEIFTSITGLEFAFTKAPKNMRSLVTAFWYFMSAFSNALGQAFVPLAEDPWLVWNYGGIALLACVGGVLFWAHQRGTDGLEDRLNMLPDSKYVGRGKKKDGEEDEEEEP